MTGRITGKGSSALISAIRRETGRIVSDPFLMEKARNLFGVNALIFQKIRNAFRVPDKGSLSDDETAINDLIIHENCDVVIGEMEVYLKANISGHMFRAAKHIISRYRERESMLFANKPDTQYRGLTTEWRDSFAVLRET